MEFSINNLDILSLTIHLPYVAMKSTNITYIKILIQKVHDIVEPFYGRFHLEKSIQ